MAVVIARWVNGTHYSLSSLQELCVQWARTNPPQKQAGYNNPGWPGCCRPPTTNEYRMIQAADWRSVSVIHQVPIPPDIKAALDSLGTRGSPIPHGGRGMGGGGRSVIPSFERRNSGSPSSRSSSLSGKPSAMSISGKTRGGSPKQLNASLGSSLSRSSSGNAISTSVPTGSSPLDQGIQRRQAPADSAVEKCIDGTHSLHSSPSRRTVDLDSSITPKRNSSGRPSLTPATPSVSLSKVVVDGRPQAPIRRRASISSSTKSSPPPQRTDRPISFVIPRSTKKDEHLSSASSSSGSSDSLGSLTDSTVTSDGAFTDYLSDESEAELQRQAEARAALLAQNQAEEQEFKAARQQLAHVDLRPPKSWNPTNITNSPAARLAPGSTPAYSSRNGVPTVHASETRS